MPATSRSSRAPIRLAILGCGAVTEQLHLPAARRVPGLRVAVLADRNLERAAALASRFGAGSAQDHFRELDGKVDAVLVALPNRLHASVSVACLSRGLPVLVEKPMALGGAEARAMVEAAGRGQALLQVGLPKRFARGAQAIKTAIDEGRLGKVTGFSLEWGEVFGWPLVSDAGMSPTQAGGGVLIDFGSHLLDLLCWWLGRPAVVRYADDNRGGVEADCEAVVRMEGFAGTVTGLVRLSRLRRLRNMVVIQGDRMEVEWDHEFPDRVRFREPGGTAREGTLVRQSFPDLFVEQLRAFVSTVADGGPSPVPGESVIPSVALVEECYRQRQDLPEPWEHPVCLPTPDPRLPERVLITGATGFIGARLAETLTGLGVQVVCPVRHWGRASRLARLPVEMVAGDIMDRSSIRAAVDGCDVVVHGALDFRISGRAHIRAAAQGTENVLRATLDAGVSRVVHLSSAAVHGLAPAPDGPYTEDRPLHPTGHDYCDGKIAAERIALDLHRVNGLPVTVLRPTVVYGPFGYYSEAPARAARERRLSLPAGDPGVCNSLYIDNLIQAILLGAVRTEAIGQIFYISDERPVSWREYLEAHASALGPGLTPLRVIGRAGLGAGQLWNRGTRLANRVVGRVQRLPEARVLSRTEAVSFSVFRQVEFPIEKAKRLLGYAPAVDFAEGMARTAAWIRWAGI